VDAKAAAAALSTLQQAGACKQGALYTLTSGLFCQYTSAFLPHIIIIYGCQTLASGAMEEAAAIGALSWHTMARALVKIS
jgi:ABC-type amino acid transport system permease subunit